MPQQRVKYEHPITVHLDQFEAIVLAKIVEQFIGQLRRNHWRHGDFKSVDRVNRIASAFCADIVFQLKTKPGPTKADEFPPADDEDGRHLV